MSITYDTKRLTALLSHHEGRVPHAYQDSLGFWTIGVGHLIDKRKGGRIPETIIDALLANDIQEHAESLIRSEPWIENLDPVRKTVLIDMAFNLGVAGLLQFGRTLNAVKQGNYADAAEFMLQSKWATQVGRRARRLSEMMRTGEWPTDVPRL
jgi:lysozyme